MTDYQDPLGDSWRDEPSCLEAELPPGRRKTSTGRTLRTVAPDEEPDFTLARGDHVELAGLLLTALRTTADLVHTDGALYRYQPKRGIWETVHRGEQSRVVQGFAGITIDGKKDPLSLKASDVTGSIKLAADQALQPTFFSDAPAGIAFDGSYVEVMPDGEIIQRDHAPEHRARFAYPFAFQSTATPPRWLAFLDSVFDGDADAAAKIALLQEYVGLCILGRASRYQRAIIMLGAGANGKGVVAKVVEACMPPGSVAAIAPQQMGCEYRRAKLAGALINIVSELPPSDIDDSNAWKAIVAGDSIDARHIREAPFTFRPVAGHIYSANPPLPGTSDQSDGFWRRPILELFNRCFAPHEQIADLDTQIISSELPECVSWFLAGAARAIASGQLTLPSSHTEALDRWRHAADQVRAFVRDRTLALDAEEPSNSGTTGAALYEAYREWATATGHRNLYARNRFGERAKGLIPNASVHGTRHYRVRLRRAWEGDE